ncbi:MAG TPA: PA0069 family radical SAM protein [Stellaceae bacterium]|nr:PA0069 family radical SAM protein [Stellaceae bacterium]
MIDSLPARLRKGRGAVGNPTPRFEHERREAVDDGWGSADEELPPLHTEVGIDTSRTIIARNESPDIPFDRSINPYRGCEHGCIYCFARPTHAFLGLSPGLDFETRLFAKPAAARLLREALCEPRYVCKPIALGANTDPYQPIERDYRITRQVLEVLAEFDHPVTVVTKSALVRRDIDLLAAMARKSLARVAISLTTLDRDLARRLEPRAATPALRLETIKTLSEAGIPVAVLTSPMIPALNDSELESLLEGAREAGAVDAGYVLLRLPLELKGLFREWLETHVPGKAAHVMSLIASAHGGRTYEAQWGKRMTGSGAYAEMLRIRFERACRRLHLNSGSRGRLDTTRFHRPPRSGDQLALF